MITQSKKEYIDNLKKLVNQINRVKLSSDETRQMLVEADNWACPCWDEHLLLIDLIEETKEYIELEKKFIAQEDTTEEERERWSSLRHFFSKVQIDLRDDKSTLCDLSY